MFKKFIPKIIMFLMILISVSQIINANPISGHTNLITEIDWEVTITGIETSLNVTTTIINSTATEVCLIPKNKSEYDKDLINKGKDIQNIPITKLEKVDEIRLEKISLDLSGTKDEEKNCFYIEYDKLEVGMKIKIGWESVIIESYITTNDYSFYVGRAEDGEETRDAQSFKLDYDSTITGLGFYPNNHLAPGEWYWWVIETWDGSYEYPNGTLAHPDATTQKRRYDNITCGNTCWENWTFPNNFTLYANTTYWIVGYSNETVATKRIEFSLAHPGSYADGKAAWYYISWDSVGGGNFSGDDMGFLIFGANYTTSTVRNITLHNPDNNLWTSDNTPNFNFTPISNVSATFNCTLIYNSNSSFWWNDSVNNNTLKNFVPSALPDGSNSWYISCNDTGGTFTSSTRILNIGTKAPVISSFNIEPITLYTNTNSNANVTVTTSLGSLQANLSCYVNGSSILNDTNNALTNNTAFDFSTIDSGNYSKGQNLSCDVVVWDNVSNTNTSSDYVIISDTPPTSPDDINFSTSAFYYDYATSFDGDGSIDDDGDTITYYFRVYNLNDSVERQGWSSQNNYTPIIGDVGDTLRISVFASTTDANSSSYNETLLVYLSFMRLWIYREKTNTPINRSGADELSVSIICEDDVNEINITNTSYTSVNISCAYLFIKTDATYGNTSYFRIINPTYTSFSNVTIYMLDLRYDTGIEIIITINDLTGDYDNGEIIIERYISGSLATIISQPIDIENSATLYLLKDMLYTVKVKNNLGETRVIGNLIASSPGEKILTLPQIEFLPDDAILGDEVFWNYTYDTTTGFIQLVYLDADNSTINISFVIMNESNTSIAQFNGFTTNSSRAVFTYYVGDVNLTYLSNLTINHPILGRVFEQRVYYPGGEVMLSVDSGLFTNISTYKFWMGLIFVILIGLAFSARSSKIGLMAVSFFLLMFIFWGWVSFGAVTWIVFGLFIVLTIFNFISKSQEVKE